MIDELEVGAFTGFQAVEPTGTDWKAGAETGLLDTPINTTSDWRGFLPTDECQLMKVGTQSYGDTECCTNFSSCNVCEIYLTYLISQGKVGAEAMQFLKDNNYFDANGKINFSDRFDAYTSGTTTASGNSLPAVWNAKKKYGMVPESAWPVPVTEWEAVVAKGSFNAPQDFWNVYFEKPPQAAYDLGQQFLKYFTPQYEWIAYTGSPVTSSALKQALQVAPIQIATAVCAGWNTANPILACGAGTAHATTLLNVEADAYDIYDHYAPYQKRFAGDYTISWAMRGILAPVDPVISTTPPKFVYTFNIPLAYKNAANNAGEVQKLQEALQYVKDSTGKPYMSSGVFGIYGDVTAAALAHFQTDHHIVDPQPGQHWGPQSRQAMNDVLVALSK